MKASQTLPLIAIACGGTGGHLFPGVAVAQELLERDCDVLLLVSPKEIDQQAVKNLAQAPRKKLPGMPTLEVVTLPAVGLTRGNVLSFARGFFKSYSAAKKLFKGRMPQAVLSMGGFTSAAPVLAGHHLGAKVFLHESNTIPGKANRWLAHFADEAFVYFHETSGRLYLQKITTVGMPVRPEFRETVDSASARMALGLQPDKPVLLVMGGSQGASGINDLTTGALPFLAKQIPDLQYLHLTGTNDVEKVQRAYAAEKRRAVVHPFLTEMDLALGAATLAISRSGASSLAELAALGVPAILIPYPHAADNHQYHNALAFVQVGAALTFDQMGVTPERLAGEIVELIKDEPGRLEMRHSLNKWRTPDAAQQIAERMLASILQGKTATQSNLTHGAQTQSGGVASLHRLSTEEANA
jgi:UDP-N-acetylglucosamine--N-acetylmuramyl-(pentapeptide) pyrophosphoryl-undecaprenol N-acetylglucosamine transferase